MEMKELEAVQKVFAKLCGFSAVLCVTILCSCYADLPAVQDFGRRGFPKIPQSFAKKKIANFLSILYFLDSLINGFDQ